MIHQARPASAASTSTAHRKGPAQRSAKRTEAGRDDSASRIRATMASWRVSAPSLATCMSKGIPRLRLPAHKPSPLRRDTAADSPVIRASETSAPSPSNSPSAGTTAPRGTRTRSPTCSRCRLTCSVVPSSNTRQAVCGMEAAVDSRRSAARWRDRISRKRPSHRKARNMVRESKYTSGPKGPAGSKVDAVLAMKVTSRPRATGTSMPMRRARSENQAPRRKGMPANHNTGTERIQLPQFSNCRRSSLNSPGAAT